MGTERRGWPPSISGRFVRRRENGDTDRLRSARNPSLAQHQLSDGPIETVGGAGAHPAVGAAAAKAPAPVECRASRRI